MIGIELSAEGAKPTRHRQEALIRVRSMKISWDTDPISNLKSDQKLPVRSLTCTIVQVSDVTVYFTSIFLL